MPLIDILIFLEYQLIAKLYFPYKPIYLYVVTVPWVAFSCFTSFKFVAFTLSYLTGSSMALNFWCDDT